MFIRKVSVFEKRLFFVMGITLSVITYVLAFFLFYEFFFDRINWKNGNIKGYLL